MGAEHPEQRMDIATVFFNGRKSVFFFASLEGVPLGSSGVKGNPRNEENSLSRCP